MVTTTFLHSTWWFLPVTVCVWCTPATRSGKAGSLHRSKWKCKCAGGKIMLFLSNCWFRYTANRAKPSRAVSPPPTTAAACIWLRAHTGISRWGADTEADRWSCNKALLAWSFLPLSRLASICQEAHPRGILCQHPVFPFPLQEGFFSWDNSMKPLEGN